MNLEYKPQEDAGTLLNKTLDITGFHTKRLYGWIVSDVMNREHHRELNWI